MDSPHPQERSEVLSELLKKADVDYFNTDFLSGLGNLKNPSMKDLAKFLYDLADRGDFDLDDFELRKGQFLNPEVIEIILTLLNWKEGNKNPWPFLADNLAQLFDSFTELYYSKTGQTTIKREWILHEVAEELRIGIGYMIKASLTSDNDEIASKYNETLEKIRTILNIENGKSISRTYFQGQSFLAGELTLDVRKFSGHLSIYLYGNDDSGIKDRDSSLEVTKKIWLVLKDVSHIEIVANPTYRVFLSEVIREYDARDIPEDILKDILLPILSIPTSKMRPSKPVSAYWFPDLPPYFIDNVDHIMNLFLNNHISLQKSSTLAQISNFLKVFNPPISMFYDRFYWGLRRKLFTNCFGSNKREWSNHPKYTLEQIHRLRDLADLHPNTIMMLARRGESLDTTHDSLMYIFQGFLRTLGKNEWDDSTIDVYLGCVRLFIRISDRTLANERNRVYFSLDIEKNINPKILRRDKEDLKRRFKEVCKKFAWVDKGDAIFGAFDRLFTSWVEFIPCAIKQSPL